MRCVTYGSEEVFEEAATILFHNGTRYELLLVLGALLQDDDARPQQRCQCVAGVFVGALHHTHKRAPVT